jgi:two-component system NtrC family sensor kinase
MPDVGMHFLSRHGGTAALFLTFAIFVASLQLGPGYSMNSLYTVPVLLTIVANNRYSSYLVAGVATVLMVVHGLITTLVVPVEAVVFTRGTIAANCFLTAFLVQRYRGSEAQRKRSEEALREQSALAQLGKMAAVVAHEVRNPLAGIRGAVQVIGRRFPAGSDEQRIANEVVARVDALGTIVQDLLLSARPLQPAITPVRVSSLLDETVLLLRQDPTVASVKIDIEATPTVVSADPALLKLVLLNLLMNGAEAMGGRGHLAISTRTQNGWHEIHVADQGPGIAPGARDHLFEPFFTTRPTGTGLGLVTARRILEAHGGRIDLESPALGGTVAVVRLPNK